MGLFLSQSSFWIPDWIPEISAWLEHGPFAFWLAEVHRPTSVVELGCHWGYSYMALCQSIHDHQIAATCHAVDTWQGDKHAGFYGNDVFVAVNEYNQRKYNAFSTLIRSSFDDALQYFADGSIDLLHIDGMHTYEAVLHDFAAWRPKLSSRAVVLFHDINVREREFGVWRLWKELTKGHPHFAFHHGYGLGVLGVGPDISAPLNRLFSIPGESDFAGSIRHAYARLGGGITDLKRARENNGLRDDLKKATQRLQEQSAESEKSIKDMQAIQAALQKRKEEVEKENTILQGVRSGLEKKLEERANEFEKLTANYSHLQTSIGEKEKQLSDRAVEAHRLTAGNLMLQGQKSLLEEQLAAYLAEVERLLAENAMFEGQKTQVKQQLAARSAEVNELLATTSAYKAREIELEQRLAGSELETMRLAKEERKIHFQLNDLEQALAAKMQEATFQQEQLTHQLQLAEQKIKAGLLAAEALREEKQRQEKIIKSAQNWQKRSWLKRAFHRWRVPNHKAENIARMERNGGAMSDKSKSGKGQFSHEGYSDKTTELLLSIFNESFYLQQLSDPIGESSISPLEHYRTVGWRKNLKPHPLFDVQWYLREYSDVREADVEPLEHYLKYGWLEERNPHPFFSVPWYLKHNPDVRQAGMEPLQHYITWGWKEGGRLPNPFGSGDWFVELARLGALPEIFDCNKALGPGVRAQMGMLAPQKQTILLVTHDTTRTGAPTIALNLISEFRKLYNIITVALGGGSLDEFFKKESDVFIGTPHKSYPDVAKVTAYIQFFLDQCKIKFAIVNSIESVNALPVLSRNDVPTVHLIHEFAAYSRPVDKLRKSAFLSGATIFPAKIVHENAASVCREILNRAPQILPQGYCECPASDKPDDDMLVERAIIKNALRPEGWEDAMVILGIGTVQMRKGVDLFFICAAQVIKNNPGKKIRFVWAGPGYDPEKDIHFSVYLADQIHRISAGEALHLIGEISQPQYAYELADILFVSSRMDPFPLVAQEAMRNSLPVICFEKATGTADVLSSEPLTAACVLPYLSIEAAVLQMQRLIDDPDLRLRTGNECKRLAETAFDLKKYVHAIEDIALAESLAREQEIRDRETINNSGLLDLSYLISPSQPEIWSNPSWWYCRAWASQISLRKPLAGFHPGVYAEENGLTGRDPLAHYIESKMPEGRWQSKVIEGGGREFTAAASEKAALHIHLFYPEMAEEIVGRLEANKTKVDLFVTVPDEALIETVQDIFKSNAFDRVKIATVPNRGRDIGAFFSGFGPDAFRAYEIVGHVHTKKSHRLKNPRFVQIWSDFLFENHLGGKYPMLDTILQSMEEDPGLGLVFPDDPHVISWDTNLSQGQNMCEQLGLPPIVKRHLNFPVGTFFWARTAALRKLFDYPFDWKDYPPEPLADDGTMLHALERLLPLVVEDAGYKTAVTHVAGVTR